MSIAEYQEDDFTSVDFNYMWKGEFGEKLPNEIAEAIFKEIEKTAGLYPEQINPLTEVSMGFVDRCRNKKDIEFGDKLIQDAREFYKDQKEWVTIRNHRTEFDKTKNDNNKTNMYLAMILVFSYLIGGVLFYQQNQDLKAWQNQAETAEKYIQELQEE